MNSKLTELDALGRELEALFEEIEELAMKERGGEDVAELWLRARFRTAIAFDEHVHLLQDTEAEQRAHDASSADSNVKELRLLHSRDHLSDRLSTFTKVQRGEEVAALAQIHAARNTESPTENNTQEETR